MSKKELIKLYLDAINEGRWATVDYIEARLDEINKTENES